ncbi:MAG TPA: regulatory protein RecX [Casimicrobiaceae bacterium]
MTRRGSAATSPKERAVRLLARREFARAEIEQRLVAEGFARSDIDAALDELATLGYLSDARYARALARQKAGRYSSRNIAKELRAKGVDAQTIEAAMADAEIDDAAALASLWTRRFGHAPGDEREKARQVRFLQARGFALSAILKLLRDARRGAQS